MKNYWKSMALAAVLSVAASAPALAAECSVDITGNDAIQYSTSKIDVPASCKEFTVNLKHIGKMPKAVMAHNWVLTKTADMKGVDTTGIAAGAANNFVKPGDKRVLAHTKLVGPGETQSVTFPVSLLKAGEAYSFLCTFPGHSAVMKGVVNLVN